MVLSREKKISLKAKEAIHHVETTVHFHLTLWKEIRYDLLLTGLLDGGGLWKFFQHL